jgi:hypothetical protein
VTRTDSLRSHKGLTDLVHKHHRGGLYPTGREEPHEESSYPPILPSKPTFAPASFAQ